MELAQRKLLRLTFETNFTASVGQVMYPVIRKMTSRRKSANIVEQCTSNEFRFCVFFCAGHQFMALASGSARENGATAQKRQM
jgi:hypothetical protein